MMLTNQIKKYIKSLQAVKFRQKYNKFIAEGPKICKEFLLDSELKVEYIVCTSEWFTENENYVSEYTEKTIVCNSKDLKTISSLKTPNEILIVFERLFHNLNVSEVSKGWSLYLDCIQDPGNLGTIMRIADWFNIKYVMASEDSVDFWNPKVIQSGMGAHSRIKFEYLTRSKLIEHHKEHLVALCMDGQAMQSFNHLKRGVLVIGNESKGISKDILEATNQKLTITRLGGAESLNASVACGIACHFFTSLK